jgi:hypothetical protein
VARKKNLSAEARLDRALDCYLEGMRIENRGLECPKCGQPCIDIELIGGSGCIITCKGIDEDDSDGVCDYKKYRLLTQEQDLPKIAVKGPEDIK